MLDFNWFYAWSEKTLHLNLIAYKEGQLQRRIETIMKKSGATDLKQFAKMIETDDNIKKSFFGLHHNQRDGILSQQGNI